MQAGYTRKEVEEIAIRLPKEVKVRRDIVWKWRGRNVEDMLLVDGKYK